MIPSITLLVVVVVLIGCCFVQSFKVPDGKCKKDEEFDHPTGKCHVYYARHNSGRLCEAYTECRTEKMEVCPKDTKVDEFTKWEVDFVDALNNYVCITRQLKYSSQCVTYFVCFYDQIDTNQNWGCVYAMQVNDHQQSIKNSIDFKTIEIKIDYGEYKYRLCKATTLLALTQSDGNKASVISYCDSPDPALVSALVQKLGNGFCSVGEPASKGCEWSDWTGVGRCERRLNNSYCSKTAVRHQISQDRDAPLNSCNATEDRLEECRCDLDCKMSEWTTQPCSPNQLPNGRLSCKRNLTRTIQINQVGNGTECGEVSKQQECEKSDADAMNCLTECKLSSWSTWTKCSGVQGSQKKRTRAVVSEEWVPMDERFERMKCDSFDLEESEVCVLITTTGKMQLTSSSANQESTVAGTTSEEPRPPRVSTTESKPQTKKKIEQKTLCFELEDKEITEIELHYAASISEEAGTSGLGPVAAQEIRAKCAEYGQKIIFSLHQKNISLLADNVVHLLVRIKIIDTENGRQRKKRSAALKKKLAGHLQQMFDSNPIIIKFNNNEEATLKGKPSRGDDKMQARCYGWMIGLGAVAVSLFLVGMVAILVAVEPWKRGSSRQVAVQVDGQGAVAGGTGEVVDEEEGESESM